MCAFAGFSLSTSFYVPTHATETKAQTTLVSTTQAPSTVPSSDPQQLVGESSPQKSYLSYLKSGIVPLLKLCGAYHFGSSAVNSYSNFKQTHGDNKKMDLDLCAAQAFITAYLIKSFYNDYCEYRQSKNNKIQDTEHNPNNSTIASQAPTASPNLTPAIAR